MRPYTFMRDALLALPKDKQRLAGQVLWSESQNCGCLTGTVIPPEVRGREPFTVLTRDHEFLTGTLEAWCGERGLTPSILHTAMLVNDMDACESPRARYKRVLAWLQEMSAKEAAEE